MVPVRQNFDPRCLDEQNAQIAIAPFRYLTEDGRERDLFGAYKDRFGELPPMNEQSGV
jgi:hypothetical protein